jgi:hypothetical protein
MRIFICAPLYKKATTRIIAKMALANTFISKEKKRCHYSFTFRFQENCKSMLLLYIIVWMARFRFLPAIHSIAAALAGRSNTTRINQLKTSILFWKGAVITQTFEAAIVI